MYERVPTRLCLAIAAVLQTERASDPLSLWPGARLAPDLARAIDQTLTDLSSQGWKDMLSRLT
jgi:hypothetical protein